MEQVLLNGGDTASRLQSGGAAKHSESAAWGEQSESVPTISVNEVETELVGTAPTRLCLLYETGANQGERFRDAAEN